MLVIDFVRINKDKIKQGLPVALILLITFFTVSISQKQQNTRQNAATQIDCNNGLVCTACAGAPNNNCAYGNGTQNCTYTTSLDGQACNPKSFSNVFCRISNCSSGNACANQVCVSGATPSPTAGILVPSSIDSAGTTDVSSSLNAFIAGVADGSTIEFKTGAIYRLDQGIQIANRHNLTFEGNGATLKVGPTPLGSNQLSSLFLIGHKFGGNWDGGNSNIVIRNFKLVGNSPTPGVFVAGKEQQYGVEVEDSANVEVDNVTVSAVWGDGLKVGGTSDTVWFHDSHVLSAGRNGVTVTMGQNVKTERVAFDKSGYVVLDIESNYSTEHSSSITFSHNTAGTWGDSFFSANGIAGSGVDHIIIDSNTVTGGTLYTNVTLARRANIVFTNNTSNVSGNGPILRFSHVDGLTISGNVQPLKSGAFTSIIDSTGVISQ